MLIAMREAEWTEEEQLVATVDVQREQNLHLARRLPDKSMDEKSREIQDHKRWPEGKVSPCGEVASNLQ